MGRSPADPGTNLEEAFSKAKDLYDKEGKYPVPMASAFKAWGYGAKSSGAREVRAALKYFGLIIVEGENEVGKVKLTNNALRILLDEREGQTEKKSIIRDLALTPLISRRLYEQFPEGIKSVAAAEHYLIFEQSYNETAAREVVETFLATASYARLFEPGTMADISSGTARDDQSHRYGLIEVGDFVNAEIDGKLVFEQPTRVRAIHDGWVFVEGSEAGVPMKQVELVEKGTAPSAFSAASSGRGEAPRLPLTPSPDAPLPREWREERLLDDQGEEIFIRYKGEPSRSRYEFIRDYLDFKLKRIKD